jgi:hypothetical protein
MEQPGRGRREGFLAGVIEAIVVVAAATRRCRRQVERPKPGGLMDKILSRAHALRALHMRVASR